MVFPELRVTVVDGCPLLVHSAHRHHRLQHRHRLQTEEGARRPQQGDDICTGRRLIQEGKTDRQTDKQEERRN